MSRYLARPMLMCLLIWAPALAQTPLVGDASVALQQRWLSEAQSRTVPSIPEDCFNLSAGLLSVSTGRSSPWMPLIHGEGLGTVTLGQGLMVRGEWVRNGWEVSGTLTGLGHHKDHSTRARLQEFSLLKHAQSGWRFGLEKTAMRWGYGLFGGFLMGDSHDPVPRLTLESPLADLQIFGVPMGAWGFDTFLGQLEWDRRIPAWVSNPQAIQETFESQGTLRRSNISGLRLKAAFGPHVDMTFGLVSRWGGVDARGNNIMRGLSWWNYPLGYLGAENILVAEASGDAENPDPTSRFHADSDYHNISNAVANIDLRIRFPETAERWFGADAMTLYLSRGASAVNWQWKDFLHNPFSAWSHDLKYVSRSLASGSVRGSSPDDPWGWAYAQSAPALLHINDTVGIQWLFEHWDLGIELSDLHNQPYPASTYRVYSNGRNLSGHSRHGDSLGQPLGGEVYQQGFSLGISLPAEGRLRLQVIDAIRFFRDSPLTSMSYLPGVDDHFSHLQVDVQYLFRAFHVGGSLAVELHQADQFISGNRRSNWIASLGYAFHIRKN